MANKVRIPVPDFAESADGTLYIARGDQPVKWWDGLSSGFVDAGVPAPTLKPSLTSSGSGGIVGEYYAYVRFLNARGLVSSLSPISDLHTASLTTGTITDATNEAPIKITSTAHALVTGDTIRVYNVLGNTGANGTFKITAVAVGETTDTNSFTLDGSASTGDYVAGGKWDKGAGQIDYSSIEVPTDTRVTKRQILRNRHGNINTFYIDVEDSTLVGTTFTSTKTDDELVDEVPLSSDDGTDLNLARHGEPPNFKKVIVHHFSRMFAAVNLVYREGAAVITKDSKAVTGIATGWTAVMKGRQFFPNGDNNTKQYKIDTVDVANQTLTLTEAYEGDTDPYIEYAISPPDDERLKIHYSEADLSESWDPTETIALTDDPGSGEMTGLLSLGALLHVLFEHRVYTLAYVKRPLTDGQVRRTAWRGSLNQLCHQVVDGIAYIMDSQGVYVFDGESVQDISTMIQPLFEGTDEWTMNRLNVDHAHSAHFPGEKSIRWYICLGGHRYPHHALVFQYDHQRWWIEQYEQPIPASSLGKLDGRRRVFLGMDARRVGADKNASLDGVSKNDTRLRSKCSDATLITFKDTSKNFTGASYVGVPVQIVSGTGAGQCRRIVKVEATELTIDHPWSIQPDSTSEYQIGGVRWKYRTTRMRWLVSFRGQKEMRGFEVGFQPLSSPSTLVVRKLTNYATEADVFEYDRSSKEGDGLAVEAGKPDMVLDLTDTTGLIEQVLDDFVTPRTKANRLIRFELEGVPSSERQLLYEMTVNGVYP